MEVKFEGEHLIWGQLGHLAVIVSMIAALFAALSFFIAEKKKSVDEQISWQRFAKWFFLLQGIATVLIVAFLFIIIK